MKPRPRRIPIAREAPPATAANSENCSPKRKKWSKKKRQRLAKKPGQAPSAGNKPSLLCDDLESSICQYLVEGASIIDAAILAGVSSASVTDWRARGSQEPESRYGLFFKRTEEARTEWKHRGIARMSESSDLKNFWRLLCSRYPREFRNYFNAELSGPDGQAIPIAANPFLVQITTSSEPGQPAPEFAVRDYVKNGENGART